MAMADLALDSISNWRDFLATLDSPDARFLIPRQVPTPDPSVRTFYLLKDLARSISSGLYGRCYVLFDDLLGIASCETFEVILKFLLHASATLQHDNADEPFTMLIDFCERLAGRESQLWTAYVLALMALAVPLPGAPGKLAKLRKLNRRMELAETVACRASEFVGLPPECRVLVQVGLALQIHMDAGKLDTSVQLSDVLEAATKLFGFSKSAEYIERGVDLVQQALNRCSACQTFGYRILACLVDLAELDIPPRLLSQAQTHLLPKLLMLLSFADVVSALGFLLQQNEKSGQLCLLLGFLRSLVEEKWPRTHAEVDAPSITNLTSIVAWLFTSGAVCVYPTDDEHHIQKSGIKRDFLEQLETVEMTINLYLMILWLEVRGGTDYAGLLGRAEEVMSWLSAFSMQMENVDVSYELYRSDIKELRGLVEYALRATQSPRLVLTGLPPT